MADEIPQGVLIALEAVRASGATNMIDRLMVIDLVEDADAEEWLIENPKRYVEALIAMGEQSR